jgi:EmrB/QacA subfamily drug resistance transporter
MSTSTGSEHRANPWTVLTVLCLGLFMTLLDTTIVNIALPSLAKGLDATLDQAIWVFSAYIIGFATLLVTAGRLGDLFGPRRIYLIGLVVFTLASAVCGLAQDPAQLLAARVVQGIGGALIAPQLLPILTMVFPPSRWGAAFGVTGALSGIAVLAGPTLGGVIVDVLDWRWIFFLNLPIGVTTVFLVSRFVHDYRPGVRGRLGLGPVAVLTSGLFAITFGLVEGERFDWAPWIWVTVAGGILLVGAFAVIQRRSQERDRLVPAGLVGVSDFRLMAAVAGVMGFAMLGAFFPLTIHLQAVLSFSPIRAGLVIAAMPLAAAFVAPAAGQLCDRHGGKYPLVGGVLGFAGGLLWIALSARTHNGAWTLVPGLALAGIGMGLTFAPMYSIAIASVRQNLAGTASGVLNTIQELGSLLASAIVGAVLQSRLATEMTERSQQIAAQLPEQAREPFLSQVRASSSNVQLGTAPPAGTGGTGQAGAHLFQDSFVAAMRGSLLIPVAVLLIGVTAALLVRQTRRALTAQTASAAEKEMISGEQAPVDGVHGDGDISSASRVR